MTGSLERAFHFSRVVHTCGFSVLQGFRVTKAVLGDKVSSSRIEVLLKAGDCVIQNGARHAQPVLGEVRNFRRDSRRGAQTGHRRQGFQGWVMTITDTSRRQ